ncbi:MAG: XdhC family protein [Myxococcales bacterium]|nr:XdhC family protein [Myxococcales bacterium]
MSWFADVLAALDAGRGVALATVIATGGSTPRHVGARMAVLDDGTALDTIGGGRIELEVTTAARAVAAGAPAVRVRHHLVRDLAMCCGGWMELVIAPAGPGRAALAAARDAIATRRPLVLTTAVADGALAIAPAPAAPERAPRVIDAHLHEWIGGRERAIVFGAGHVGRTLAPLLASVGFEVIVCDDDDTGALATPVVGAAQVIDSFDVAQVAAALGGLGQDDHVLVVTRDHAVDERLMLELIPRTLGYLGMIGSRGKVGRFQKRLAVRGIAPEAWRGVHAPVGLDLGAETPAEIAVAIAAELVALRRRGERAVGAWEPRA